MSWLSSAFNWWARKENHEAITPLLTVAAASGVAIAALLRHFAQTKADRERRITESFSKAVEQLGSEKIEVRLGGIYGLERISKESDADYWTIMETLTAFVRERARWKEPDENPSGTENSDRRGEIQPPPTDIAAVLTVINRRSEAGREREKKARLHLDLRGTDLRRAFLAEVHLEGATLAGAHLEAADLMGAYLEAANLRGAHLEYASLRGAHLESATLNLQALSTSSTGLNQEQIDQTYGDGATRLPEGLRRPDHWPAAAVKTKPT